MLVPVSLPPGMYKNGTPYAKKGRWADGSLVRWHDGAVRPIGGWQRRTDVTDVNIPALVSDPVTEVVRDAFAWRSLTQATNYLFGSNTKLYHLNALGVVTDVTPGTASTSGKDAVVATGYGSGPYGAGAYGVENNLAGVPPAPPLRWSFTNFGEVALFLQRNDSSGNGYLYELDLTGLTTSVVTNAPTNAQDVLVTDQRQVVLIGGDSQPRRVQLSDIEDRTDWTPATANQAVDRTLAGAGRLLKAVNVLRQVLIVGENDAHVMEYVGPPYVVSTFVVGEQCGAIAPEAVVATDRFAVWWGERNFWLYDGSLQLLKCEVMDFLYKDLEISQLSKVFCLPNQQYTEVTWFYQSNQASCTEVDSYVTWDYGTNTWTTGRLCRTAAIGQGASEFQLMVNHDGVIYNHELQDVFPADEGQVFVRSGPLDMGNGEVVSAVRYIYPDVEALDSMSLSLIGKQLPTSEEYTYGPYTATNPTPVRALGRSISLRADFLNSSAELGIMRFDMAQMGGGRR